MRRSFWPPQLPTQILNQDQRWTTTRLAIGFSASRTQTVNWRLNSEPPPLLRWASLLSSASSAGSNRYEPVKPPTRYLVTGSLLIRSPLHSPQCRRCWRFWSAGLKNTALCLSWWVQVSSSPRWTELCKHWFTVLLCLFSRQGRWLFALLACLEKPLLPGAHSSIRQLARRCAQLRSALVPFQLPNCPLLPSAVLPNHLPRSRALFFLLLSARQSTWN